MSAPFQFKQFSVSDRVGAMKIGTDGVLLGAWALKYCRDKSRILDVGAGTGLISMMLAQRFNESRVTGIEIDPMAAVEARENVAGSPWSSRIDIINADFIDYTPSMKFTAIVSNPPFFENGEHAPDSRRALARHEQGLTLNGLIPKSSAMLEPGGVLSVIVPFERLEDIIYKMAMCHLDVERVTSVSSRIGSKPIRVLIEGVRGRATRYEKEDLSIRDNQGNYTKEYIELTKDFYLNM